MIDKTKEFVLNNNRLPSKREYQKDYKKIYYCFGSWNNMIKLCGFCPNTEKFSKKHIANDGHKCDSLSEKIIDDWLYARNIPHKTKVIYPWNNGMSADFKVNDIWIELFGLCGQLKTYDKLMENKLRKIKEYNLNLISLYLSDIFPKSKLDKKLKILQK